MVLQRLHVVLGEVSVGIINRMQYGAQRFADKLHIV
jgi:hypothetical protein